MRKNKHLLSAGSFMAVLATLILTFIMFSAEPSYAQVGTKKTTITRTEVTQWDTPAPGCYTRTTTVTITCPDGDNTCTPQPPTPVGTPVVVCP